MNSEDSQKPFNNRERRRVAPERRDASLGVSGYTVDEWCALYDLSRSFFYKLRRLGLGPRVMKIGNCTRISPEADEEFRRRVEAETAAGVRDSATPLDKTGEAE